MIVSKPVRNKKVFHTLAAVFFSVVLILGICTSLSLPAKQQKQVFAQGVTPPTNEIAPVCNSKSPTIKLDSTGAKVKELQIFLLQLGYGSLLGQDGTGGKFTAFTQNAVKKFQQDNGLQPVDGIVGQKTWNALCSTILNKQQLQEQAAQKAPSQTPAPAQSEPEATIYRVTFRKITVNENHDTRFGTGEWKLFALVNDKMRQLDTCDYLGAQEPNEKRGCDGKMNDVEDGQVVNFPSNLYTDVKIGKGGAIALIVEGIDTDGEDWKPPTLPHNVHAALWAAAAISTEISGFVNPINAIAFLAELMTYGGDIVSWIASLDENDKLGTIHKIYRSPKYQSGVVNTPSSTRDYELQYSIKALSPQEAYYSSAEDCKPPIVGIYCGKGNKQ
jgi:putative peptidoglycan binding protein